MNNVVQFPNIPEHHNAARNLMRNDRDTYGDIDNPDALSDEEIGKLINERYEGGWDTFVADEEEYSNAREHKSPGIPPVTFAGKMNKQEMDVASGKNVVPFPLNRGASFRTCASCNMVLSENEIKISKELLPNYSCHKCITKTADHGFTPCPDCGGNIKFDKHLFPYTKMDNTFGTTGGYQCENCKRKWNDIQAAEELVPGHGSCPRCGSEDTGAYNHSNLYGEGASQCFKCGERWSLGQNSPDAYQNPDSAGDLTIPNDWA
jgi:Zn finger protein HypA/HybF involved in hydrogenase expression